MKTMSIRIFSAACAVLVAACACAQSKEAAVSDAGADKEQAPRLAAVKMRIKCRVCNGRGELKVRPPDIGQYGGLITNRSHWDVKLDPCPICGKGNGRCTVWDLSYPEPSAEPPCTTCGWSGIVKCRKCLATGTVQCRNRNCDNGWILPREYRNGRRGSAKVTPSDVVPCPQCHGVGKVVCGDCRGMLANLCRKCHGTGRKRK